MPIQEQVSLDTIATSLLPVTMPNMSTELGRKVWRDHSDYPFRPCLLVVAACWSDPLCVVHAGSPPFHAGCQVDYILPRFLRSRKVDRQYLGYTNKEFYRSVQAVAYP